MSGNSDIAGQITSFWPFEAVVLDVNKKTGELTVHKGSQDTGTSFVIPPLYYGGVRDSGLFRHPNKGDRVLCIRVHPGSRGTIQALKVIPKPNSDRAPGWKGRQGVEPGDFVPTATTDYPIAAMNTNDMKLAAFGGGQLLLEGSCTDNNIYLGNDQKSGLYISLRGTETKVSTVGHTIQSVSTGSRLVSGDAIRFDPQSNSASAAVPCGHQVLMYPKNTDGKSRGIWPGRGALNIASNELMRNPPISEYRLVINELSEHSGYIGYDQEVVNRASSVPSIYERESDIKAIGSRNALHLAPHQLIEIIGGNVVNHRGEVLDPNYGVVKTGDDNGLIPSEVSDKDYESARLISRRGIGYHFQLSTNSLSEATSNDNDNFICAIDKEGILKLNVPKSSNTGNVLYPTDALFYRTSGGTLSKPSSESVSEKIPVTLRNEEGTEIYPTAAAREAMFADTEEDVKYTRQTGVRHTNEDGYFHNLKNIIDSSGGTKVRVNSTKYHNMYAAAEMLIGNLIKCVHIPTSVTACPGIVLGNSLGQSFERKSKDPNADGSDANDVTFMSTVEINPGPPAMDPGGEVLVAGKSFSGGAGETNVPYTNSFSISEELATESADKGEGTRKESGGKSANLNFEGSIETSVGADNQDGKSIVLDTAGALVAWFGTDSEGRSVVVQTDGDFLLNVGGRTGDNFSEGRFELRVNMTDKGYCGQEGWAAEDGNHASDYIISISEAGLVIAGMKPGAPMIIRNDGNLCLESTAKLILAGNGIEVRQANRPPRETHKAPCSDDPAASPKTNPLDAAEEVGKKIQCITDLLADLADSE